MRNVGNYEVLPIDLTGGKDRERYNFSGTQLYYDNGDTEIFIRLGSQDSDPIPLKKTQRITIGKGLFSEFFIDAPDVSETITLILSNPDEFKKETGEVTVDDPLVEYATQPYDMWDKVCVAANVEYNFQLAGGTKKFTIQAGMGEIRVAIETGKVAGSFTDFLLIKEGQAWSEDGLNLSSPLTLYIASSVAGAKATIIEWT